MPVITREDALRPGFSLAMEVLCSIPCFPSMVQLKNLVADFAPLWTKEKRQEELQEIFRGLRDVGFKVHTRNVPNKGRFVYIEQSGYEHAERTAEKYWQTVWGDQRHTAIDLGGPRVPPSAAA